MPWFKVDDGFHGHPKVMDLSLAAVGLWTLAGTWCANYLTDGEIPLKVVQRLGGTKKQAKELVLSGLWAEKAVDLYQFCDWDHYQPTKETVEAEREKARERMGELRAKRKGTAKAETPESSGKSEDVRPNNSRTEDERSDEQPENETGTPPERSGEVRVAPTQPLPLSPVPNPTNKRSSPPATPDGGRFAEFWEWYPRKVGKPDAKTAYKKAIRQHGEQSIIDGAERYRLDPNLPAAKFIPYPATWLNREGWNDPPCADPAEAARADRPTGSQLRLVAGYNLLQQTRAEQNGTYPQHQLEIEET